MVPGTIYSYGDDFWVANNVQQFGLEQTLRKIGRPKKKNGF